MRTYDIYIAVEEITENIYMYQSYRFPVKYSWGNIYAMILYNYDSNTILAQAMKNGTKEAIIENISNCMEC